MPKDISSIGKTDLTAVQHVAPPFIPGERLLIVAFAPSAAAGCMGSLLDARNASCDLPQDRTRRIGRCIRQFGNRREEPTQQQDNQDSDVETHCPGLRVRARRRCMTTSAATRSSPGMAARPLASLCYTMLNDGAKALSWSHL